MRITSRKRKTNGTRYDRIVDMKELQLIDLYCTVCRHYNSTLAAETQRLSNNFCPKFTDEECITIYLFGIAEEKFKVKGIHKFIKEYWHDWFPNLPSYQNFNRRINYLGSVFQNLCSLLLSDSGIDESVKDHLIDSMPIVVAKAKRSGSAKAAKGLCDKGYCATKKMYYYGVKLHALGQKAYQTLPKMCLMSLSSASENDFPVGREMLSDVYNIDIYADKMYICKEWADELAERNIRIFTPVKLRNGQKRLDSADSYFSAAVSRAKQALESFFNWVQAKTNIQNASFVRSDQGLIAFVWARIASLLFFYS